MEDQESKGSTILMAHQEITIPRVKKKVILKEEEDSILMTRAPEVLQKCTMSVLLPENQDRDLPLKASEEEAVVDSLLEVNIDLAEAISTLREVEESSDPIEVPTEEEEDLGMNSLKALIELKWAALLEVIVASSEALVEAEEVAAAIEEDITRIVMEVLKEVDAELENLGFLPTKGMETSVERAKRQLLLECTKDPEEVELKVPSKTEPNFPQIYVIEKKPELLDRFIF